MRDKKKLAILVNMIAPYRVPILASLAETFDTVVLHGGKEPNRTWNIDLPDTLKSRRVFTLQIPLRKKTGVDGVSDVSYLHLNLGLVWWLFRLRPDIVISNELGLRSIIAVLYGKITRVPVWVWWGGTLHSERNVTKARRILRRILVRLISHWISYGATTTEYLESLGVPRQQILQAQNCVPHETFETVPTNSSVCIKSTERPRILTVGQLVPRKGIDKLIEACGRLTRHGARFSLVVVGQGSERDRLNELARANQIEHFEILPNQPQPTLNAIYRSADVFVFPTLEDVWGLVVNEAMWAGVPVLCSKYAGCAPELLPTSHIFDPLSNQSIDSALAKLFERCLEMPDCARLATWQEVSRMISLSLESGIAVSNFPSAKKREPASSSGCAASLSLGRTD